MNNQQSYFKKNQIVTKIINGEIASIVYVHIIHI